MALSWLKKKVTRSDFEKLDLETSWVIAVRSCARSLPLVILDEAYQDDHVTYRSGLLCTMRALMSVNVQITDTAHQIEYATRQTRVRSSELTKALNEPSRLASEAAYDCANMIERFSSSFDNVPSASYFPCKMSWDALQLVGVDARQPIFDDFKIAEEQGWRNLLLQPLWENGEEFGWAKYHDDFRRFMKADDYWKFWNRWYVSLVSGSRTNTNLVRNVITIPPYVWKYEEETVDQQILSAQEEFLFGEISLPERLVWDEERELHSVIPYEYDDERRMENAICKVADSLEEIRLLDGSNAYAALSHVVDILDRTFDNYRHEPLRIHDDFLKCAKIVIRSVDAGELPDSDHIVSSLLDDLSSGAIDIQLGDEYVSRTISERAAMKFRAPTPDEAASIENIVDFKSELSDEKLRRYLNDDKIVLLSLKASGEHDFIAEPNHAAFRLAARLPKINKPKSIALSDSKKRSILDEAADKSEKVTKIVNAAGSSGKWLEYFISIFS